MVYRLGLETSREPVPQQARMSQDVEHGNLGVCDFKGGFQKGLTESCFAFSEHSSVS